MDKITNKRLANCEVPLLDYVDDSGEYRLIIAVLGYDKMKSSVNNNVRVIAGENQVMVDGAYRASLVGRIHNLLESYGIRVSSIEQSTDDDSFALLMHASINSNDMNVNIGELRRNLVQDAQMLGVTLRIQREELFAYMHRI
ncbi:MAG: ACT domain-containing protein [bacterium]|nr:ACT domain-containing protein [bacterium]